MPNMRHKISKIPPIVPFSKARKLGFGEDLFTMLVLSQVKFVFNSKLGDTDCNVTWGSFKTWLRLGDLAFMAYEQRHAVELQWV